MAFDARSSGWRIRLDSAPRAATRSPKSVVGHFRKSDRATATSALPSGADTVTLNAKVWQMVHALGPACGPRIGVDRARHAAEATARESGLLAIASCRRRVRQNNPTGKSPKVCPAPRTKIFRWPRRANQEFNSARLPR